MLRTTFLVGLLALLCACGDSATETSDSLKDSISDMADVAQQAADVAESAGMDTSWFYKGGSLYKGSTLEEWRNASNTERLASAADLLKGGLKDLPAPAEAIDMARTLESEITSLAESGQDGTLGEIAEQIFSKLGW